MKVSEYLIVWRDKKNMTIGTDHIQALSAQQAVDFISGDSSIEIIDVAKVCKNWK